MYGRKKLIHNAPYDVLSVSRVISQVDLCCNFRAIASLLRIPFPYCSPRYSFCVLRSVGLCLIEFSRTEVLPNRTPSNPTTIPGSCVVGFFSVDVTLASLVCARTTRSFLRRPRAVTYN